MADIHLGAWRDPRLKELCTASFKQAIKTCIDRKVDFVLIAGDLFHTAIPGIDIIKLAVNQLKKLKAKNIPVYVIPGSHDYSPSGKTMIDVLEEAELLINVMKGSIEEGKLKLEFTQDPGTKVKITGVLGKKGMLDKKIYDTLDLKSLEAEKGKKIFMFHTALDEMKPKEMEKMDSYSVAMMPKGFEYYAGGHVHIVKEHQDADYNNVIYPGPIFPANFSELEKLRNGGLYIVDEKKEYIPLKLAEVKPLTFEFKDATPETIMEKIKTLDNVEEAIVLIRIKGTLDGNSSDVKVREIIEHAESKGAMLVLVNKAALLSKELHEIKIEENTAEEIEKAVIKEHLGQIPVDFAENEAVITRQLIKGIEGTDVYKKIYLRLLPTGSMT